MQFSHEPFWTMEEEVGRHFNNKHCFESEIASPIGH